MIDLNTILDILKSPEGQSKKVEFKGKGGAWQQLEPEQPISILLEKEIRVLSVIENCVACNSKVLYKGKLNTDSQVYEKYNCGTCGVDILIGINEVRAFPFGIYKKQ